MILSGGMVGLKHKNTDRLDCSPANAFISGFSPLKNNFTVVPNGLSYRLGNNNGSVPPEFDSLAGHTGCLR